MDDLRSAARISHPRPDFVRPLWHSLDGAWRFAFDDGDQGLRKGWQGKGQDFPMTITVPFTYQSKASGIGVSDYHPILWYQRAFEVPADMAKGRVLLRFGAVDESCTVYVNGHCCGGHKGGYTPFALDVTPYLKKGENNLVVRVLDTRDCSQPRGKQYWEDGLMGCWYTPCSGIWQTVYLEGLPGTAIDSVHVRPDIDNHMATIMVSLEKAPEAGCTLEYLVAFEGREVRRVTVNLFAQRQELSLDMRDSSKVDSLRLWSPEQPNLYDLHLTLRQGNKVLDQVSTYFGLRKVEVKSGQVLLNNTPIYQRLILDQGYWPETLLTPPDAAALIRDIQFIKDFGFNGVRKHQKVEDPRFYYWCDRMGLLVWGELPSAYEYSGEAVFNLAATLTEFIKRDFNHPSIITWVPLNESWGVREIYNNKRQQAASLMLYHLCKALDGARLVSGNDGWEQTMTDISAIHDYAAWGEVIEKHFADRAQVEKVAASWRMAFAEGFKPSPDAAFLITEYGGIAMTIKGAQGKMDNMETWGYHDKVESEEAFMARFCSVTDAIRAIPYCKGYCYTQLTDVMQEINGLLSPERVPKIDPALFARHNTDPEGFR
ncbi:MAG: glycoside hydrolase family 2 protein [Christensenellales bacterium]